MLASYVNETSKAASEILKLFAEGLGLENEYFKGELSDDEYLVSHYYPPCPDPSLTLGLYPHGDVNLLTILQQDAFGLQFIKDGKWLTADVIPNAFVVSVAIQLQVLILYLCL